MKLLAPSALILAVVGWALTVYVGSVLLSGTTLAERSCQTGCIQVLFFSTLGVGAAAFILAGVAVWKQKTARVLSYTSLILAAGVLGINGGIVVIGVLA